ncbi:MAG: polymer-forming cytoskeletal protein [Acidobacteria bacterium]|nr:polymer-forming cytoskeletal protein [Acidobacteriota bacterium]
MWGRKEESAAPSTDTPAVRPAASHDTGRSQAESVAARPSPGADRSSRSQAQIGKALKLKGEITGSEDVYIDGEVEGTIELRDNGLTVGPNGNVRAHVKARSITVLGRLEGNVTASERIEIRKTGSLEGDLVTPRVVIEDGAVFRGSIDILRPAPAQSAPASGNASLHAPVKPQKAPPAIATAAGASSVTAPAAGSAGNSKS